MPRPENKRSVHEPPLFGEFKPVGIPGHSLGQVFLSIDEFEAVRLADYLGLSHEEASLEMEISRSTFTRLIEKARKKIADFMVSGKIMTIDGGSIHFRNNIIQCSDCGYLFRLAMGAQLNCCPDCWSTNLINLAGGFGHGQCCLEKEKK
jgi:predicted DNA-binding protein (UPF0251 family)